MTFHYFCKVSAIIIIALICSGILVGFINTLAGGGTIISLSLLMFLGLPPTVANGTNRIAVTFQNIVAVLNFKRNKVLDLPKGLSLSLPIIAGSLLGAKIAVNMNETIIERAIAIIMVFMMFMMFINPDKWLKGNNKLYEKRVSWKSYVIFFLIGLYGGFIHVGVGYFLLAALVLHTGFDLVRANAVKNFLVLVYTPFTLLVFIWQGHVVWKYGLVHSVGNIVGAYLASRFAVKWGTKFVRWVVVAVILLTVGNIMHLYDVKELISKFLN